MNDNRLSKLAVLNIHQDENIDAEIVLRDFDASGHRRINLVFQ